MSPFKSVFDYFTGGETPAYDAPAMAAGNIQLLGGVDTSKITESIEASKSLAASLSGAVMDGGFLAVRTDGTATSMIVGSDDVIAKMADGRVTVDVNMPEMKTPNINLRIEIDGKPLTSKIREIVREEIGDNI